MADEQTRPPETALTIALAEYTQLQEARRAVHTESNARFTFFLGVASAATAVSAGLVSAGGATVTTGRAAAAGALGGLVLLLGLAVFARQLEFNDRARRYAVAATAIRTYLVRQAPDLAPYVMMPTLDDSGPFAAQPYRRGWPRDLVSLAGTVGLLNSALLAATVGLLVARAVPAWAAATLGALVLVSCLAAHVAVFRRRLARSAREVGQVIDRRPALAARPAPVDPVATPDPVSPVVTPAPVSPEPAGR
ncbi:hypothetical protein O7608_13950 [Solwaraspora sp. WMMA2056]|uniref:hypothetical protein n=1 Tax=Solwaraspora sp. WMMA2056 TaxID=3015161 RepID=UPI00259B3D25|nr:hypothetical protein [Solwaraspora sp. WMMA2056]WJK43401.1 hypothetical protein O7608_13950 [Solwaraspora sp. WMMA2056]